MVVYAGAFTEIRNKYILPLSKYNIQYSKLEKNNIKTLLFSENLKKVDSYSKNKYKISFNDNAALFTAILGDIKLMYIRMLIQEQDFMCVSQCSNNISANWNIVTAYYHGFFSASLLLRLCFRGNIYLDNDKKAKLEITISELIGLRISLNNNLFYEISKDEEEWFLILSNCDSNTHKAVWEELNNLLQDTLLLTKKNSDEYNIINTILCINRYLSPNFPSLLRNRVNYQTLYGKKYIDNKLYHLQTSSNWVRILNNFSYYNYLINDDTQLSLLFYAYDKYITIFAKKLIYEYYEYRGRQDGVIKQLNKKFINKINVSFLPFDY